MAYSYQQKAHLPPFVPDCYGITLIIILALFFVLCHGSNGFIMQSFKILKLSTIKVWHFITAFIFHIDVLMYLCEAETVEGRLLG